MQMIERQVAAERVVVATLLAAGAKDVTMPTYDQARQDYLAALDSDSPSDPLAEVGLR